MRLKSYTAKTLHDAMEKVREDLGDDAIIVNVSDGAQGSVRVMAAIENRPQSPEPITAFEEAPPEAPPSQPFDGKTLSAMLRYHGLPGQLATRIQTAASAIDALDLADGLAAGLETVIGFQGLGLENDRPILMIGPPGAGKTLTTAKIAASTLGEGGKVRLINMDTVRAGAQAQIDHYARLMQLNVSTAEAPEELRTVLSQDENPGLTVIDTVGINPYSLDDVQLLAHTIKLNGVEPVFVLPAGIDPLEAAEMADIFASLGARRIIITKLDAARRYAGLLTAMYKGRLSLAALANRPYVADGLLAPTPLELSRLIIAKPDPSRLAHLKKKAVP